MARYPFTAIEKKWQARWEKTGQYRAVDFSPKPKCYLLIEFPYPSGAGLHVGHPRSYTALDVVARKRRMEGYNVLYPIGFDAFGLPAENYAIKTGTHPRITTAKNIANFTRQLKSLGLSFDWSREVNTTDPGYYKWTQWMFLRMFRAGLAYKAGVAINWCPDCNVGLANEEAKGGKCERCGCDVVRRTKDQWMLRITRYADRLIEDLDTVDFIDPVVYQQRDWIGKSHGADIHFPIDAVDEKLVVFTTRPDTVFGATYMVVSPEHPLIDRYQDRITNYDAVVAYREEAARKSDLERTDLAKEKTGVELEGLAAINPATGAKIPIWTSDYVLMSYGTGAIMAVPGHDQRDWEFARTFDLPIVEVVQGGDIEKEAYTDCDSGVMVNSGILDGLEVPQAIDRITQWLEDKGLGRYQVNYKLRDWVFSRQRYWGEPIPLVHCEKCGWVPVPDEELPLLLPEVADFKTGEAGESPLAHIRDWVEVPCPKCGGPGERETDTMPQWAGSCWYFLRYIDPHNDREFASRDKLEYWMPVDWYNGGMEHTTLHLLYSRFWCKFLYDEGLLPHPEPYARRTSHGMILGADARKMSKTFGNVVNPDEVVRDFGADTFRGFEMYMGAFDQTAPWSDEGVVGVHRFLNRVWSFLEKADADAAMDERDQRLVHQTIKAVGERIERMKFNTALAALMSYSNELARKDKIPVDMLRTLCVLLHPFTPHITEEMWERLGGSESVGLQAWPEYDPELAKAEVLTIAVQVNGKLRDTIDVEEDATEEQIIQTACAQPKIQSRLAGNPPRKTIYVKGRLLNIIAG